MYTEVNRQCVQIHSTHIHATWFMWARPPCRPGPCMYAHTHIRTHVTILHFQNTLPFLSSVAYLRLHYPEARLQQRLMTACSGFIRWSARGERNVREGTLMLELLPPSNCREIALGHGFFLREKRITWRKVILHHYWISDPNTNKGTIFHPREWEEKSLHLKKTHTHPSGSIYIKAL